MDKIPVKKIIIKHLTVISAVILYIIILKLFSLDCIIKAVIGMPCPTCGITRSVISMFKLDFKQAFYYHPLSIPIIAALLLGIHSSLFKKGKKYINIFVITVAVLTFACYVIRIITNTLP